MSQPERTQYLQQKISLEKNKSLVGKSFKTLIEKYDPKSKKFIGRSEKFSPEIDGLIYISPSTTLKINTFAKIKITAADPYDLYGTKA